MLSTLTLLALQAVTAPLPAHADTVRLPVGAGAQTASPILSPVVLRERDVRPPGPPVPVPGDERRGRHEQGGWRLAFVFGDSADHTRHNAVNVLVLSGALLTFLWTLPVDVNRFETPQPRFSQFIEAYTKPPLLVDGDWWFWNVIGHPFVGSKQYLMERNWGMSQRRAFLFSAASSLVWEYGFEAAFERPSVQDMLLTAPAGWVIGEPIYRLTQRMRRGGFSTAEKVVVLIINPLHVLQHGFR